MPLAAGSVMLFHINKFRVISTSVEGDIPPDDATCEGIVTFVPITGDRCKLKLPFSLTTSRLTCNDNQIVS